MMLALALALLAGDFEADYDAAVAIRRAGETERAAAAFLALSAAPKVEDRSRALVAAANLLLLDPATRDRALPLYDRVLAAELDSPAALRALRARLYLASEQGGDGAALAVVTALYARHPRAEHTPVLLLEASERLAALGRLDESLAPLVRLEAEFADSTRLTAARMAMARRQRALGRPADALKTYRRILAARETSLFFGEYDSALVDDAHFEAAETLAALGDLRAAEDTYVSLARELPTSRHRPEALRRAAALAGARGDASRQAALAAEAER